MQGGVRGHPWLCAQGTARCGRATDGAGGTPAATRRAHLSATFLAVCRNRAWSFSFRMCSAWLMRTVERSRHCRQLATCWASFLSFITCRGRRRCSESGTRRGGCELPGGRDHLQQGPAAFWGCGRAFAAASILKLKARGCSKRGKDRKGVRGMGEQELEN